MTRLQLFLLSGVLALGMQQAVFAQNVVEHGEVGLTYEELERIVKQWTPQMQKSAAEDFGDRLELLNVALTNKKIAQETEKLSPDIDPDVYWEYVFKLQSLKRQFIIDQFVKSIEVPDMTALSRELYETQKEEYAGVAERRTSSHILFACPPGECSRAETKAQAQIVLDELRAGADFEEMVEKYSGDPGSKAKGGKFDKWMFLGEVGVTPPYSGGLFEIEEIGEYSDLVSTQFGIHIIRLDGIEKAYFKPYAEVKDKIIADLEMEYRKLAVKAWLETFQIGDDAYIDGAAMEKLFAPYGTPKQPLDGGS